jgi:hypothetical protein
MKSGRDSKKELSYSLSNLDESLLLNQTPPIKSYKIHEASVDSVML